MVTNQQTAIRINITYIPKNLSSSKKYFLLVKIPIPLFLLQCISYVALLEMVILRFRTLPSCNYKNGWVLRHLIGCRHDKSRQCVKNYERCFLHSAWGSHISLPLTFHWPKLFLWPPLDEQRLGNGISRVLKKKRKNIGLVNI